MIHDLILINLFSKTLKQLDKKIAITDAFEEICALGQ